MATYKIPKHSLHTSLQFTEAISIPENYLLQREPIIQVLTLYSVDIAYFPGEQVDWRLPIWTDDTDLLCLTAHLPNSFNLFTAQALKRCKMCRRGQTGRKVFRQLSGADDTCCMLGQKGAYGYLAAILNWMKYIFLTNQIQTLSHKWIMHFKMHHLFRFSTFLYEHLIQIPTTFHNLLKVLWLQFCHRFSSLENQFVILQILIGLLFY